MLPSINKKKIFQTIQSKWDQLDNPDQEWQELHE